MFLKKQKPRPEGEAGAASSCSPRLQILVGLRPDSGYSATSMGSTITNLPMEPLFRNLMRPVILANRVSSLPRPTFSPGFTRVPRCRTMMVPPGTICPPKALNPSRCAFESRPLREVPCPFLCAMDHSQFLKVAPASRRLSRGQLALADENYFFFGEAFLALLFLGAAFFLACPFFARPLVTVTSDSCSSAAATFLGFGCFFSSSGALKLCPSKAISVMRTAVYACRCPRSFLYCFLRL